MINFFLESWTHFKCRKCKKFIYYYYYFLKFNQQIDSVTQHNSFFTLIETIFL